MGERVEVGGDAGCRDGGPGRSPPSANPNSLSVARVNGRDSFASESKSREGQAAERE